MINSRIISVDIEDELTLRSIQDYGHNSVDDKKIRYGERRSKINEFLKSYNNNLINLNLFNAVTPKDFSIENKSLFFNGETFAIAENSIFYMANTLSHYKLWNLDEDTLVFEDDIIFNKENIDCLPKLIEEFETIPNKNKILYLQISTPWLKDAKEKNFSVSPVTNNIGKPTGMDISGTAAYYLNREAKKILLNNMRGICGCDRYM